MGFHVFSLLCGLAGAIRFHVNSVLLENVVFFDALKAMMYRRRYWPIIVLNATLVFAKSRFDAILSLTSLYRLPLRLKFSYLHGENIFFFECILCTISSLSDFKTARHCRQEKRASPAFNQSHSRSQPSLASETQDETAANRFQVGPRRQTRVHFRKLRQLEDKDATNEEVR